MQPVAIQQWDGQRWGNHLDILIPMRFISSATNWPRADVVLVLGQRADAGDASRSFSSPRKALLIVAGVSNG